MKKTNKWITVLLVAALALGTSCVGGGESSTNSALESTSMEDSVSGSSMENSSTEENAGEEKALSPLRLPDCVQTTDNIAAFAAQAQDKFSAQRDGIIISPYYAVKAEGEEIPVYAVPAFNGETQNIAMFDVEKTSFPLRVEVKTSRSLQSAEILPLNYQTECTLVGDSISFEVSHFGYYTLQGNGSYDDVLTVAVREKEEYVFPEGTNVIEYEKGIHYVDYIDIPSNTTLYLHSGAMLIANPPKADEPPIAAENSSGETNWRPFIQANDAENVSIVGRGLIDTSALHWGARNPVQFNVCTNVKIDGLCIVNTANWNMTIANSSHVEVENIILLSTRRNSDGIAIVDCSTATVHDCFARSGDDLFEVKSMYAQGKIPCENILFERCIAWSDSCRSFGVIHETSKDITNVTFQNCAVLYSTPTWSEDLGSLVVINGIRGHVSNITFTDIEIYSEAGYVMNVATGPNQWSESSEVGRISSVRFENILVHHGNKVRIKGIDSPTPYIDGITYKNIRLEGKKIEDISQLNILRLGNIGEVKYEATP